MKNPNFNDLATSEFTAAPSSLFLPIIHVILICAQKQVSRITARWIIAFMAYEKAFIERSECESVRQPMGAIVLSKWTHAVNPVPIAISSGPIPAFLRPFFIHVIPKVCYVLLQCADLNHKQKIDRRFRSKARTVLAATEQTVVKCFEFTQFLLAALKPKPSISEAN